MIRLFAFSKIKKLLQCLKTIIEEFLEDFPEFLESFSSGYTSLDKLDMESKLERLLKTGVQRDKILLGRHSVYRVSGLWSLADFHRKRQRYLQADSLYQKSIELMLRSLEEDKRLPFRFRENMSEYVEFLSLLYRTDEAEYLQGKLIEATHAVESPKQKAKDLALMAGLCARNGKTEAAVEHFRAALTFMESTCKPDSSELIDFLESERLLMNRYNQDAFPEDCIEHLQLLTELTCMDRALGRDHHLNITSLEALSRFYERQGKEDMCASITLRRDIARLAHKTRSAYYPGLNRDLKELAELYKKRNEPADATLAFHALKKAEKLSSQRKSRR